MTAGRHLDWEGCCNVRDLGGLRAGAVGSTSQVWRSRDTAWPIFAWPWRRSGCPRSRGACRKKMCRSSPSTANQKSQIQCPGSRRLSAFSCCPQARSPCQSGSSGQPCHSGLGPIAAGQPPGLVIWRPRPGLASQTGEGGAESRQGRLRVGRAAFIALYGPRTLWRRRGRKEPERSSCFCPKGEELEVWGECRICGLGERPGGRGHAGRWAPDASGRSVGTAVRPLGGAVDEQ
jgi:hypothetical protein